MEAVFYNNTTCYNLYHSNSDIRSLTIFNLHSVSISFVYISVKAIPLSNQQRLTHHWSNAVPFREKANTIRLHSHIGVQDRGQNRTRTYFGQQVSCAFVCAILL